MASVQALFRFPVKSMAGEQVTTATLTPHGLLGDRRYALVDAESGGIASAADPRRWAALLRCRARYVEEPGGEELPPVLIEMPDGTTVSSDDVGVDSVLSKALGRAVTLVPVPHEHGGDAMLLTAERVADQGYWLSVLDAYSALGNAGERPRPVIGNVAPLHLVTTATVRQVHRLAGGGSLGVGRLRANVVIDWPGTGFVENDWPSQTLTIGGIAIEVLMPTPRCVLPTLPTADHPDRDRRLLQAARQNRILLAALGPSPCLGVYARPTTPGTLSTGAPVALSALKAPS